MFGRQIIWRYQTCVLSCWDVEMEVLVFHVMHHSWWWACLYIHEPSKLLISSLEKKKRTKNHIPEKSLLCHVSLQAILVSHMILTLFIFRRFSFLGIWDLVFFVAEDELKRKEEHLSSSAIETELDLEIENLQLDNVDTSVSLWTHISCGIAVYDNSFWICCDFTGCQLGWGAPGRLRRN